MKKQKNIVTCFETFRNISSYDKISLTRSEPSCFNGNVNIRKYRITIDLIDEPKDVLSERLQKLWDECSNRYHWYPIQLEAKKIGYELKNKPGNKNNI